MDRQYSVFIAFISSFCLILSGLCIFVTVPDISLMATSFSLSVVSSTSDTPGIGMAVAIFFTLLVFFAVLTERKKISAWVVGAFFILATVFLCAETGLSLKLFL